MTVTVSPSTFAMVHFDHDELVDLVQSMVDAADLTADVELIVNERTPLGGLELRSIDPVICYAESGALEDPKRIRYLSAAGAREAVGKLLLEARDRLDDHFGAPPLGEPIPSPHRVAWDTRLVGELVRLGGRDQQQRRRFSFRHQHGFTDRADSAFDRLWESPDMTWAQITELSDQLRSARSSSPG